VIGFDAEGYDLVDWKTDQIGRNEAKDSWKIFWDFNYLSNFFEDVDEYNSRLIRVETLFKLLLRCNSHQILHPLLGFLQKLMVLIELPVSLGQ
jgi:hypothetical protein